MWPEQTSTGMQGTRIVKSSARWFGFIIFLPATSASARRHFELERISLSLVSTKIAGSIPMKNPLQVLESKMRASGDAAECPYLVDGRCPHAGTGKHWLAFNPFRQILSALIQVRQRSKITSDSGWNCPLVSGRFRSSRPVPGMERGEMKGEIGIDSELTQAHRGWAGRCTAFWKAGR